MTVSMNRASSSSIDLRRPASSMIANWMALTMVKMNSQVALISSETRKPVVDDAGDAAGDGEDAQPAHAAHRDRQDHQDIVEVTDRADRIGELIDEILH